MFVSGCKLRSMSNFIRQRVTEKKEQTKTIYSKHQNTVDMRNIGLGVSVVCIGVSAVCLRRR